MMITKKNKKLSKSEMKRWLSSPEHARAEEVIRKYAKQTIERSLERRKFGEER